MYGVVPLERRRPPAPGSTSAPRREVDADRAEARQDVGAEQADRLPLPADLGQRGRGQLLRRQATPSSDQDADGNGLRRAGAADAGEQARRDRPTGRWSRRARAGVDGRLPRAGVEDEGERSLAVDADVDRLGHLAGHRAHGQRHLLAPAGQRGRAAAPGGGRRQCEGDLRLDVHRSAAPGPLTAAANTSASTVAPMATMAAISQPTVRRPRRLAAEREPGGGDRHARPEHQRRPAAARRGASPSSCGR